MDPAPCRSHAYPQTYTEKSVRQTTKFYSEVAILSHPIPALQLQFTLNKFHYARKVLRTTKSACKDMTDRENKDKQFHMEMEPDVLNKNVSFFNWLLCLYVYHRLLNIELLCTQPLSSVGIRQPLLQSQLLQSHPNREHNSKCYLCTKHVYFKINERFPFILA